MKKNGRSKNQRKRRFIKYSVRIILLLFVLGALGGGGYYTYAKYFSESAQWGIAIASKIYFTANHAAESEAFVESVAQSGYSGGYAEFFFEVRNYENNLLFNESTVEIPYSVSFWVETQLTDAVYSVGIYSDGQTVGEERIPYGKENKLTFTNQNIGGGAALANSYIVKIEPNSGVDVHNPIPIYVEVNTNEGAVIDKTLRGKMVLGESQDVGNVIDLQRFVSDAGEAASFEEMQELSVFTYEILTVGSSNDELTQTLTLYWRPEHLEIDLFDESYLTWQGSTGKTTPLTYEDADGITWYYITLDAMPYSLQNVSFLRGTQFSELKTIDEINAVIKAVY